MSYCRFPDSGAYILKNFDGYIQCMHCTISKEVELPSGYKIRDSFFTQSYREMIDHVKQHQEHGDKISNSVISRLLREQSIDGPMVQRMDLEDEDWEEWKATHRWS